MVTPALQEATWERMIRAVEKVRERCARTVRILETAGIPYAVVGGHAVANWVASIDEGSVRNTRDVDILIRRADLDSVKSAMEADGFIFANAYGVDFFLDGPNAKPSEGVHLLYAGEKVKETDPVPTPEVTESERGAVFQVVSLEALVRMKLVAFRLPIVMVPVLSNSNVSRSPAVSTALPLLVITFALKALSIPAIPMALNKPPMVVGIKQTYKETKAAMVIGVLA